MNLSDMEPGECRWVCRNDIHVYCRHPAVSVERDGQTYWCRRPEDRRYAIACPDAGLQCEVWMTEDETMKSVRRILKGKEAQP